MVPTAIKSIDFSTLDLPLQASFGISGGVQHIAQNALVRIELVDGTVGHGEAAPLPPYNGETQATVLDALRTGRDGLVGHDADDWRDVAHEFRTRTRMQSGSAQAALEIAILDALARRRGISLTAFFGAAGHELETDMTITTGSVADAGIAAREIARRGIRRIKVKVGGSAGVRHDLLRLEVVREIAPDAPLILDGNAGLTRAEAGELIHGLQARRFGPALLEQWLAKDDLAGMRALHLESGWPLVADESVANPVDALRVARAGAAQVINIKLMKAGIATALDVIDVARECGLELMIGGNVESILAMTAAACIAAGVGGFRYADLDTPLFLAQNPFVGGYELSGGIVSVAAVTAGHGVRPK